MLIATLPSVHQEELMKKIIAHPLIEGVRYNTGACSSYAPKETLERILLLTKEHNKKFWVDLKGRQLRIKKWAVPVYGKIELNHNIEVDTGARVFFRGNEWSEIKVVKDNVIYVDPPPRVAVGEGQAINIVGKNLKIEGYSTDGDYSYIEAAVDLGVSDFMLSFVECLEDIAEVSEIIECNQKYDFKNNPARFVLKIESPKGLDFVKNISKHIIDNCTLMAARDDLMINIGDNKARMISAMEDIISKDPDAILASRIFSGLESNGEASMSDFSDICLSEKMGYKNFMLSDGICQRHFDSAMKAWEDYSSRRKNE